MAAYILRRLLLVIPTMLAILLINFAIVQAAPGGPVDQAVARLQGLDNSSGTRMSGGPGGEAGSPGTNSKYRGAQGLDPQQIEEIKKQYGFDKPAHERLWLMLTSYAKLDFGKSFYRDKSVIGLIVEKMPVSLSLGLWSTLIIYFISIPLGIRKALRDGSRFDVWSSGVIIAGYAIPGFLFAILLIVLFAGGSYWQIFPMQGLVSENFASLSAWGKVKDYAHHMVLPTLCISIGGFATLTILTKNSFLDEINKQYVLTARAKGLTDHQVLYGHVFRNAMLIIIAGIPATLVGVFLTGSLLIEVMFNLDGLGLLGFESVLNRDYPVIFGTLFLFTLVGMLVKLVSDLVYVMVDPRIDFESREARR
ncbi:MAG TPA: microcin C ABC transporter permease YejB [Moraxellaceae bacterium]|nr:microcin C ABC transporter permease YejB [Moraxellaceae bacterium]